MILWEGDRDGRQCLVKPTCPASASEKNFLGSCYGALCIAYEFLFLVGLDLL